MKLFKSLLSAALVLVMIFTFTACTANVNISGDDDKSKTEDASSDTSKTQSTASKEEDTGSKTEDTSSKTEDTSSKEEESKTDVVSKEEESKVPVVSGDSVVGKWEGKFDMIDLVVSMLDTGDVDESTQMAIDIFKSIDEELELIYVFEFTAETATLSVDKDAFEGTYEDFIDAYAYATYEKTLEMAGMNDKDMTYDQFIEAMGGMDAVYAMFNKDTVLASFDEMEMETVDYTLKNGVLEIDDAVMEIELSNDSFEILSVKDSSGKTVEEAEMVFKGLVFNKIN